MTAPFTVTQFSMYHTSGFTRNQLYRVVIICFESQQANTWARSDRGGVGGRKKSHRRHGNREKQHARGLHPLAVNFGRPDIEKFIAETIKGTAVVAEWAPPAEIKRVSSSRPASITKGVGVKSGSQKVDALYGNLFFYPLSPSMWTENEGYLVGGR